MDYLKVSYQFLLILFADFFLICQDHHFPVLGISLGLLSHNIVYYFIFFMYAIFANTSLSMTNIFFFFYLLMPLLSIRLSFLGLCLVHFPIC